MGEGTPLRIVLNVNPAAYPYQDAALVESAEIEVTDAAVVIAKRPALIVQVEQVFIPRAHEGPLIRHVIGKQVPKTMRDAPLVGVVKLVVAAGFGFHAREAAVVVVRVRMAGDSDLVQIVHAGNLNRPRLRLLQGG